MAAWTCMFMREREREREREIQRYKRNKILFDYRYVRKEI